MMQGVPRVIFDPKRGQHLPSGEWDEYEWEPNRCPLNCSRQHDINEGFAEGDIVLTGKSKPYEYRATNPNPCTTGVMRGFNCDLCGHRGWSTDSYLEELEFYAEDDIG